MKKLADYNIGDEIPKRMWTPTEIQLRQYAEASGDYNPIHLDERYAQDVGLKGVIAQGMLTMAQVGAMLTDWIETEGMLSQFDVRFVNMVRPGDKITCEGRIVKKLANALVCSLAANNQHQQNVIIGQALVIFKLADSTIK